MIRLQTGQQLTARQEEYLRQIGLSQDAIDIYKLLLRSGPLTAAAAGLQTCTYASAQYRLFYALETHGLVMHTAARPRMFQAVPLQVGLPVSLARHQAALQVLLGQFSRADIQHGGQPTEQRVEIIIGRQALYDRYESLADGAKHEIWVYAIGIAYSESLEAVQKRAIKRGVSIHHVVQQIKPSNYHVIHHWQRLGVRLRYASGDPGYHLTIFDDTRVIITFSNPVDTDDRLSIITTNPQAVRMFRAQFQAIWQEARDVEI